MSAWEKLGRSDDWLTPEYIFFALGVTFNMDVAAPEIPCHVPARASLYRNSLDQEWSGLVWMNPPYGGRNALRPWLKKFFDHGNGIALVPDRTSAPWFQETMARAHMLLFVREKIKFERPDGTIGKQPGTGSALVAMGGEACSALCRSKLGLVMVPIE